MKYHIRFNVERKFHELKDVNFSYSVNASQLDNKFVGLKWITPGTTSQKSAQSQLEYFIGVKNLLKNDKNKKIVITNYSIFSVILNENVSGYTRWFPGDDSAYPTQSSKFFKEYKEFVLKTIKNKKIQNIYVLPDVKETYFTDFVEIKCIDRKKIELEIIKFEIKNVKCF